MEHTHRMTFKVFSYRGDGSTKRIPDMVSGKQDRRSSDKKQDVTSLLGIELKADSVPRKRFILEEQA